MAALAEAVVAPTPSVSPARVVRARVCAVACAARGAARAVGTACMLTRARDCRARAAPAEVERAPEARGEDHQAALRSGGGSDGGVAEQGAHGGHYSVVRRRRARGAQRVHAPADVVCACALRAAAVAGVVRLLTDFFCCLQNRMCFTTTSA